jgi:type I restriction enzyme S subunit
MNKNNIRIPNRWILVTLEEILSTIESGGRPKGGVRNIKEGIPSIGGEHLSNNGGFDFSNLRYIPKDFFENMKRGKIKKHDVLVVKDGATTGKTSFVSDSFPFKEASVNEHVFILRTNENVSLPKYLFFWMLSPFGQNSVKDNFQGTAQGGINTLFIKNSIIPIPPLSEQHRIVAKIEELFTKLDAGVEALKKAKEQIKRYRQAVLKYAFEGKLTEEWRKTNKDKLEPASVLLERIKEERKKKLGKKYRELSPVDTSELPELPEGWVWTRIGDVTEVTPEDNFSNLDPSLPTTFVPMSAIDENTGTIKNPETLPLKDARKGHTHFRENDILFARITPCMENGKSAVATKLINGIGFGSTEFIVIRPPRDILPKFIFHFIRQETFRFKAKAHFKSTVGQLRVPKGFVINAEIPLPPLPEQHRIVEEIERRLSIADAIEKTIDQSLKQSERLRQSILKMAFEGKLVPQDPTDEPAEKLLERIRDEKAKRESKKKVKKERR